MGSKCHNNTFPPPRGHRHHGRLAASAVRRPGAGLLGTRVLGGTCFQPDRKWAGRGGACTRKRGVSAGRGRFRSSFRSWLGRRSLPPCCCDIIKLRGLHNPCGPLSNARPCCPKEHEAPRVFHNRSGTQRTLLPCCLPGGFTPAAAARLHQKDPVATVTKLLPRNHHRRTKAAVLPSPDDDIQKTCSEFGGRAASTRKSIQRADGHMHGGTQAFPTVGSPPVDYPLQAQKEQ